MSNSKKSKTLFEVGEKVLCYEPDPTKAQVLYDSKVLEVVERREKGKKCVEYKIHFQGWNPSWDRFVGEKYILKRDDENLELQDELREKAKVLKDALKAKKKKQNLSLTELIRASMDKSQINGEGSLRGGSTSGDSFEVETSDDDGPQDCVQLAVPETAKQRLENDFYLVTEDKHIIEIPAKVNVAQLLEDYARHFAFTALAKWIANMRNRPYPPTLHVPMTPGTPIPTTSAAALLGNSASKPVVGAAGNVVQDEKPEPDELSPLVQRVQLVKEVAEGVRVMFDFLLNQILLYNEEMEQFRAVRFMRPIPMGTRVHVLDYIPAEFVIKVDGSDYGQNSAINDQMTVPPDISTEVEVDEPLKKGKAKRRKKVSYSEDSTQVERPTVLPHPITPLVPTVRVPRRDSRANYYQSGIDEFLQNLDEWRITPDYSVPAPVDDEPNPSYIYGYMHLLRLLVKLPQILNNANMPRKRLGIVVKILNLLISHMSRVSSDDPAMSVYHLVQPVEPQAEPSSSESEDEDEEEDEQEEEDEDYQGPSTSKKSWKRRKFSK